MLPLPFGAWRVSAHVALAGELSSPKNEQRNVREHEHANVWYFYKNERTISLRLLSPSPSSACESGNLPFTALDAARAPLNYATLQRYLRVWGLRYPFIRWCTVGAAAQ